MEFRWPFNKLKSNHWVGINLSALAPSAVIYSDDGVIEAVAYDQEQGLDALELWIKKHVSHGMPTVLVLADEDYELLLVEAPEVPDEELTAAIADCRNSHSSDSFTKRCLPWTHVDGTCNCK